MQIKLTLGIDAVTLQTVKNDLFLFGEISMSEIKIQNWGFAPVKNLTEKELKKLKKEGKFFRDPKTRRAPGSKNARWGQCE